MTRIVTVTIAVTGSGDDMLSPYIERMLKIWMARGTDAIQFEEDFGDYSGGAKATLKATGLNLKHDKPT